MVLKGICLLVAIAIAAKLLWPYVSHLLDGRPVYNHRPGPCKLVDGVVHGAEDGQLLGAGLAIVSSGLRGFSADEPPMFAGRKGQIFLFDFNSVSARPFKIVCQGRNMDLFNPHGVYVWKNPKTGKTLLYVVNHARGIHSLEKFDVDAPGLTLTHLKTITDSTFTNVNDLVVIGEDRFYVTNWLGAQTSYTVTLEVNLFVPWGSVVYYEPGNSKVVLPALSIPNGINMSPDGKLLYLMVMGSKDIQVYNVQPDHSLEKREAVVVFTGIDNVDVDPDTGDLWIGCHPNWRQLLNHIHDINLTSPSQVLRVRMDNGRIGKITEVYSDDGHQLTGSTFAIRYKDAMLAGTVYHKLLYCKLNSLDD